MTTNLKIQMLRPKVEYLLAHAPGDGYTVPDLLHDQIGVTVCWKDTHTETTVIAQSLDQALDTLIGEAMR